MERIDDCRNNSENSSATKVGEHIRSGFSRSTILLFENKEKYHDV